MEKGTVIRTSFYGTVCTMGILDVLINKLLLEELHSMISEKHDIIKS